MINIAQDSNNNIYLDLTVNSQSWVFSSSTPYFLFNFTSESTNESIYFVADNIADISARTRYDQFNIIETGSTYTNLTGGTISLSNGNFWLYKIYEQTTRDNLNPTQTIGLVGEGRVFYKPNTTNNYIYFTGNTGNNIFFKTY